MKTRWILLSLVGIAACAAAASANADAIDARALTQIIPGHSTKADLQALLGAPWRVVQFDDCGQAMAGQADETWEYRGKGPGGTYRVHVEFDEQGVVHLIAEIPDKADEAVAIAITASAMCLSM